MNGFPSRLFIPRLRALRLGFVLPLLVACANQLPGPSTTPEAARPTPLVTVMATVSSVADATFVSSTAAPIADVNSYQDEQTGLQFQFPKGWQGPSVYHAENEALFEIGTDTVYPYGTSLDERKYEVKDAYFVAIRHIAATTTTVEQNKQRIEDLIGRLQALPDGESISGPRALQIRIREIQLGKFRGLEFIDTLSDSAQTEFSYSRIIVVYDDQFNILQVTGYPHNVTLKSDPTTMTSLRADYGTVDEQYRPMLYQILESISLV